MQIAIVNAFDDMYISQVRDIKCIARKTHLQMIIKNWHPKIIPENSTMRKNNGDCRHVQIIIRALMMTQIDVI